METVKYLIFVLVFLYITNWFQVNSFVISLLKPRSRIKIIKDQWIFSVIKQKTGLNLKRIIIFESEKLFGMMPSIPLRPELILSSSLYKKLNRDELEWVILHEAGHCALWHTPKSAIVEAGILILGVILIGQLSGGLETLIFSFVVAVLLSLICIRVLRHFEYEADRYSITKVDNPRGVISAQDKFKQSRNTNMDWFYSEHSIFRKLLFWNIMPSERVMMAKMRLRS